MKLFKYIAIVAMVFIVSFFYFPVGLKFVAGYNTKTIMAGIGIAFAAWAMIKKPAGIPKNLIPLFLLAAAVSVIGAFSVVYNGTIDTAYATYIISMAVWLSAAFVVCVMIEWLHGYLDVKLVGHYIIAVCVMQCISALLIDNVPAVNALLNSIFDLGKEMMEEMHRLYGLGSGLDVAGIRFSVCLIIIAAFIHDLKDEDRNYKLIIYVLCFLFISVVGCMMARTTYVGIIMSIGYWVLCMIFEPDKVALTSKRLGTIVGVLGVAVVVCVLLYNTNVNFRFFFRFAFEGFFNLFESGEYSVASTDTLKSMYVFPDNLKTWIIGDGYFSNPYWSDPNYIWHGEATRGYYMGTDVGYLRFIFYFGVIGLFAFSIFLIHASVTCIRLLPKFKLMFLSVIIAGFIVWLKVATDVFPIFALFICVGNMMDEPENEDEEDTELIEE